MCVCALVYVSFTYVSASTAGSRSLDKFAFQSSSKNGGTTMQMKARSDVLARLLAMPPWVCTLANKHHLWNAIVADEPEKFFGIWKTLFSIVPLLQVPDWMLRLHDAIRCDLTILAFARTNLQRLLRDTCYMPDKVARLPAWALTSPHRVLDILVQHHPSTALSA